jgi:hypothetical protein
MKFSIAVSAALLAPSAYGFSIQSAFGVRKSSSLSGVAEELDLPCEDECAITSFPNMPESVHPGVLTGQAQLDLLNHAKENGKNLLLARVVCSKTTDTGDVEVRRTNLDQIRCFWCPENKVLF